MKKRIAAILAVAVTAAIGASSSAQASGDPLYVALGPGPLSKAPLPLVTVNALLGPSLGDAICTPENQVQLGDYYSPLWIAICKQP